MFLSWGWGVGAEVRVPVCVGCEWIFFFCTKTAGVTEVVRTGGRLICPPSPPSHQPSALQDLDDPLGRQAVAHSPALTDPPSSQSPSATHHHPHPIPQQRGTPPRPASLGASSQPPPCAPQAPCPGSRLRLWDGGRGSVQVSSGGAEGLTQPSLTNVQTTVQFGSPEQIV